MNCDVISKHQFLTMLLLLALLVPAAAQHISLQLEHALDGARFTPAGRISGNLEVDEVHRLLVLLTLRLAALPMVASCRLAYAHCIFKAMHLAMHNKTGLLQLVLATRLAQRSFNGPVCCLLLAVSTYMSRDRTAAWQRWRCSATPSARPRRLRLPRLWRATGAARLAQVYYCCSCWLLDASVLGRMYLLRAVPGGAAAPPLLTSLPARCLATPGFRERLQVSCLAPRAAKQRAGRLRRGQQGLSECRPARLPAEGGVLT